MKSWYASSKEEVLSNLKAKETGLTTQEAEERKKVYGPNALAEEKKKSLLAKFFSQFKDMMIIVLLVAAVISAVLAIIENDLTELVDSGIILAIVIINAIIGVIQENKAEGAMEALKNMNR